MTTQLLRYAINSSNELVSIEDVPNGISCQCFCPKCKEPLVAKNAGIKKEHHFAHCSGSDCPGATMTALHLLAQKAFQQTKKIKTPHYNGAYYKESSSTVIFDKVTLEQTVKKDDIYLRPDCVAQINKGNSTHELWVEMRVTHEVDEKKQSNIKKTGVACIEIDLRPLLMTNFNEDTVAKYITNDEQNRIWISCPKLDKKDEERRREHQEKKRLKEEDERRRALIYELEHKKLKEDIHQWLISGDDERAKQIQHEIEQCPYDDDYFVVSQLVEQESILHYILHSPKNQAGREIFYTLARFYYKQFNRCRQEIWQQLKKWQWRQFDATQENDILFEELLSAYIIAKIVQQTDVLFCYDEFMYKKWINLYINKRKVRENCFICLAPLYQHIIATNCKDITELTEWVIINAPNIASLFLKAIDYFDTHSKTQAPPKQKLATEHLRQYVMNNPNSEDEITAKILRTCYPYTFAPQYNL